MPIAIFSERGNIWKPLKASKPIDLEAIHGDPAGRQLQGQELPNLEVTWHDLWLPSHVPNWQAGVAPRLIRKKASAMWLHMLWCGWPCCHVAGFMCAILCQQVLVVSKEVVWVRKCQASTRLSTFKHFWPPMRTQQRANEFPNKSIMAYKLLSEKFQDRRNWFLDMYKCIGDAP